jgi:hypothetical protein
MVMKSVDAKRNQPAKPGTPAVAARGAAGPAAPLGEILDQVGRDIQQLRVDFERFFAGDLPVPPEDLRTRVQNRIRMLRNVSTATAVESFRLGDLEARFNTYNELFNRRLREREEGRPRHPAARPAAPPAVSRLDARAGIVVGRRPQEAAVLALYEGLVAAPGGGQNVDLETFRGYLSRQAAAIREKTGCEDVQFRLTTEDGKVKLKARPLPGSSNV